MVANYLKVAFRNVWKYKTHGGISVLSLAVGIVTFTLTYFLVNQLNDFSSLPEYEQRIELRLRLGSQSTDLQFSRDDLRNLQKESIPGLKEISIHSISFDTEGIYTSQNQEEIPFLLKFKVVDSSFYSYYDMKLKYGNRLPVQEDEILISQEFARRINRDESPVGHTLLITPEHKKALGNENQAYTIVNVVESPRKNLGLEADLYVPLNNQSFSSCTVRGLLAPHTDVKTLNRQLESITWERNGQTVHPCAFSISELEKKGERYLFKKLLLVIISLILLTGMIHFLKFIIQLFYNRQRELSLRKCLGESTWGMFFLLFCEVFWILTAAFLLSLVLTELVVNRIYYYFPESEVPAFPLCDIYILQFILYIVLMLICFGVIGVPIRRMRKVTVVRYLKGRHKRPVFRNIMIGVQLCVSLFFVGSVLNISLIFREQFAQMYRPLTPQQESHVLLLSVNSLFMNQMKSTLVSEISRLPEITGHTSSDLSLNGYGHSIVSYTRDDQTEEFLSCVRGDTSYFSFFYIPFWTKEIEMDTSEGVYISEGLQRALFATDSLHDGTIRLNDKEYQIAGVYKALYREAISDNGMSGSVFFPDAETRVHYFRVCGTAPVEETIRKIEHIGRRYIPVTLPFEIRRLNEDQQTIYGSLFFVRNLLILLAFITLLLFLMSVYSAISIDTVSRQKEIAIRKINGATPNVIARLFARTYVLIFLISFVLVYPILRYVMIEIGDSEIPYGWEWGGGLFVGYAVLLILITAYKIYRIMYLNPSEIIKNEF